MATELLRRMSLIFGSTLLGLIMVLWAGTANAQRMMLENISDPGPGFSRSWIDVNNDGKDDYCMFVGGNAEQLKCYLSNGSTFNNTAVIYNVGNYPKLRFWWVDVNGDGRVDLCRLMGAVQEMTVLIGGPSSAVPTVNVECRLGLGFAAAPVTLALPVFSTNSYCPQWDSCQGPALPGAINDQTLFFADVNADGRADFCYVHRDVDTVSLTLRCHLMTDTGFAAPTSAWIRPIASAGSDGWPRGFFDVNGDGYPDFCRIDVAALCVLGSPAGLSSGVDYNSSALTAVTNYKEGAAFVDINGDGKTDFCRITGPSVGNYRLSCRLSTGKGWESTDRSTPQVLNEGSKYNRWWVDINGDGLPDFCRAVGPDPSDFANPANNKNSNLWCRLARGGDTTSGMFALDDIKLEASTTHGYLNFGRTDGGRGFCDAHGTGVQTLCRATFRETATGQVCFESAETYYCADTVAQTHGIAVGVYGDMPADPNTSDTITVADPEAIQAKQPLLSAFSDGLGAETRLTYLPLTSERVYDRTFANEKWPRIQLLQPRSPVVFETRAWRQGTSTTLTGNARYAYRDLRVDNQTGSRGFRERWQLNEGANTLEHVIYYQGLGPIVDASSIEYSMLEIGTPKESKAYAIDPSKITPSTSTALTNERLRMLEATMAKARATSPNPMSSNAVSPPSVDYPFMLLKRTANTLGQTTPANPLYRPVTSSTTNAWDWNVSTALALPSVVSTTSLDDVGNVLQLVETTTHAGQEWKRTTTNTYADDRTKHYLGRLKTAQVVSTAPTADVQIAANTRSAGGSPNANTVSSVNGPAAPITAPAFANTLVGQNSTVNATLTNTLASPLVIVPPAAASVTGQDFSFVSTTCGASLPAAGTCTITVRFTPTAAATRTGSVAIDTASGLRTAALTATSQNSFSTATLTSVAPNLGSVWYGASPAPTANVSFRNDGNTAMTLTGLTGLSSRFTLSANTCSAVAPTASCSMTITMPTSAAGSGANPVTTAGATTNATFDINGTVNSAVGRWSVTTLAFGSVTTGQTKALNLTLFNDGFGQAVNWAGGLSSLPAGFTANMSACASITPGGSCAVSITFAPTAAQAYSGSGISPSSASYTSNTLAVSGTGALATTTLNSTPATSLGFGTVAKDFFKTLSLTLTNTGTVAANGLSYAIAYTGGTAGVGDYTRNGGTCPAAGGSLAAGASCTMSVTYVSGCTAGTRPGTLTINGTNLTAARVVTLTASTSSTSTCN
jgi:hypothetical protein